MKRKLFLIILLLLVLILNVNSQNTFSLTNNKNKETFSFKLVNNIILIPVTLNGVELTFLLDTGVKQSLLFNVAAIDSLDLNQVKKVKVKGLGEDKYFSALKSKNNLLRISDIVCPDFDILVILEKELDFSARMGSNVHGIIGSELFKDFIIKVNYSTKKITVNNPKSYKYKKCRKCQEFPLTFHFQKPYISVWISGENNIKIPVKLLIDSGSGDALWLFDRSSSKITISDKNYNDFLGKGLSGNIFGKKSKLNFLEIGKFSFKNLLVSYPDSTSILGSDLSFKRNGIIGSEILKRLHAIYDYPNKKITLKKNKKFYENTFYYDKSGLDVIHNGKILVKEEKAAISFEKEKTGKMTPNLFTTHTYSFKNSYIIALVKANSVAQAAGLQKGDIILELNGKPSYTYTLQALIAKLSGTEGKKIKLLIERNGSLHTFKFKLKDLL